MGQWLASGRRRDLCILLSGTGGLTTQELKRALETHYDTYLSPDQFHRSIDQLRESGYVERTTSGTAEEYRLTERGQTAVTDHYRWMDEEVGAE